MFNACKIEKNINMVKVYVGIHATIDEVGKLTPTEIIFKDICYKIDRVLDVRPAPDKDSGGFGTRYTIRINGKLTYLWEDMGKYYVNEK